MPEITLLIHAIVALLCAIEIKVSMGNRERMDHLMRENWEHRQNKATWLAEAKVATDGENAKNGNGH